MQGVKQAIRTKGHYITNGLVSQCLLIGGCNRLEWGGLRCNYCEVKTGVSKCLNFKALFQICKCLIYMYLFPKGKCLIYMYLFRRLVNDCIVWTCSGTARVFKKCLNFKGKVRENGRAGLKIR